MADLEKDLQHLQLPVVTRTKEESIGAGAYGSVYEVMVHGTLCAAKEMHPLIVNETKKRAFLSECVQSSRILHPNVVSAVFRNILSQSKSQVTMAGDGANVYQLDRFDREI